MEAHHETLVEDLVGGLVGPYVLAVWIGDFRGEGNPAFVGTAADVRTLFWFDGRATEREVDVQFAR